LVRGAREYVLVTEIGTPESAMILAARVAHTNLLLDAGAEAPQASLSAGASIAYQSNDVIRLTSGGQPLLYNAYRVKESWWDGSLDTGPFGVESTDKFFDLV